MRWLVVNSKKIEGLPEWKRSVGLAKDGTLFIPAVIGGGEKEVSIATLRDKISIHICFNHVYVPMVWLVKNFPKSLDICWIMGEYTLQILRATKHGKHLVTRNSNNKCF